MRQNSFNIYKAIFIVPLLLIMAFACAAPGTGGNKFKLSVEIDPLESGNVTVDPDKAGYQENSTVILAAVPADGYHFSHWSGDAAGDTNPVTVVMDADKTVAAVFDLNVPAQRFTLSVEVSPSNAGNVNKNPAHRNKFKYIFLQMKNEIANEVVDRLEYCEPTVVRDLLNILKESASEKAHLVTKKLMSHKNAQVRWVALEKFEPRSETERNDILKIFKKEKNKEVKKKAASVLLRTKNAETIDRLFHYTSRNIFRRKFLIQLVELCGHIRAQESFAHLKRLLQSRALFHSKTRDDMRIATVTSLARLQNKEAADLVMSALQDKRKRVRERVEILLKLDESIKSETK